MERGPNRGAPGPNSKPCVQRHSICIQSMQDRELQGCLTSHVFNAWFHASNLPFHAFNAAFNCTSSTLCIPCIQLAHPCVQLARACVQLACPCVYRMSKEHL
ncbi:hypothetical protein AAHE18_19G134200 [Arachis hypogaea]